MTDLDKIEEGKLECRLDEITRLNQRRLARISFVGAVRGVNEDGPNRQQLNGYLYFDLDSRHISYVSLKGVHFLLDKTGKEQGRVEGQFVLTRQLDRSPDLSDEALKGVKLEPDDDNTRLLYDHPDVGVRFLYPRRWHVAGVHGQQLGVDESNGSGLLLTLDPLERLPTRAQYLAESTKWLQGQKAKIVGTRAPQMLQGEPFGVEHFSIEVEENGKRALLDYYVIRQKLGGTPSRPGCCQR